MNNRLNRGFTIVELAIVLVVIGIILGMAVKGKQLVYAARMKAEIAKINKFEAAASIYFAKHNGELPLQITQGGGGLNTGYIPMTSFITEGILTAADLKESISVDLGSPGENGHRWAFFVCKIGINDQWEPDTSVKGTNLRVCAIPAEPDKEIGDPSTAHRPISDRLSCNIEVIKDDENRSTGEGRGWYMNIRADDDVDRANYSDCMNYPESSARSYAYKIF